MGKILKRITQKISDYFEFSKHKTSFKTEIIAGISTFLALSYIFVVNPSILAEGGMNQSMVLFATIIASSLGTIAMGLWGKNPFVLAPGMEINAYVAFFVILGLGFSWQQALGAVFWSGIIFIILTLTGIREKIINAIPDKMKSGLALSVGVFLMLIALRLAGILIYEGIYIKGLGVLFSKEAYVLYFGLSLVLILRKLKVPASVLISILLSSFLANYLGLVTAQGTFEISKEMFSGMFQFDLSVILDPRAISVILVLFIVDFYGSVAKFIGLTRNTSIAPEGKLPRMKESLLIDGSSTVVGSALGTSSLTAYVESGVGISEGGRTGLTAVVCGILMLFFLLLTPVLGLVPVIATTGALVWVGISLFPSKEDLKQYTLIDKFTVTAMILTVIATFSIDKALLLGLLVFFVGLIIKKNYDAIDRYMVISVILLAVGVVLSL